MKIASCGIPVDTPKLLGGGGGSPFARSAPLTLRRRCLHATHRENRSDALNDFAVITVIIYSMPSMCARHRIPARRRARVRLFRFAGRGVAHPPSRWRDLVLSLGRAPRLLLRRRQHIGGAKRFPEEHCARLEDIHANKWASYEPRPVRILASRFIQLDPRRDRFTSR